MSALNIPVNGTIQDNWLELPDFLYRMRVTDAFAKGNAAFSAFRQFTISVRMEADELFDRLADGHDWHCERIRDNQAILFGRDFMSEIQVTTNPTRISMTMKLWASCQSRVELVRTQIMEMARNHLITDPMFSLVWTFLDKKGDLNRVDIEEVANDDFLESAYPMIQGGVTTFIEDYLSAPETVLVLQGPPGTGKTRLIRHILAAESRKKKCVAKAVYTTDQNAMLSDALFVKFITGSERFLVVEDADHILRSREDGNEILHRFLAIADGVVSAQGRKIIFTTNLPNIGDIDAALVRPGRCYGHKDIRELSLPEATTLVVELGERNGVPVDDVIVGLVTSGEKAFPLAEVFRRFRRRSNTQIPQDGPSRTRFGFIS